MIAVAGDVGELGGIADGVDHIDPTVAHAEGEHRDDICLGRNDHTRFPVHAGRLERQATVDHRRHELAGHGRCPVERQQRRPRDHSTGIEVADDAWVQDRQQVVEVAPFARVHESCDHDVVLGPVDVEPSDRLVGLDATSGTARQLATCLGRPPDESGDGLEVDAEDVVKHERRPLGRAELFEDDHQGHAHRVVEGDPICEIDVGTCDVDDRLREPRADVGPLDPLMGPKAIDAQPGGHRDEPTADVVEGLDIDGEEPAVRILHRVLGIVNAAEHPVGDIEHSPAVLAPDLVDPGG
jgi:hypothetical protein